jgi:hypothetical protein
VRIVVAALAAALVAGLAVVAIGRWERSRHADAQNAGIARVVRTAQASPPAGFRFLAEFQCLIYARGDELLALEVCVDWDGRVVEAIDRRAGPTFWSLREDPDSARVRVDRSRFENQIVALDCDECRGIFERARLPGGQARR